MAGCSSSFRLLQLQCSAGRGLPVLQEAELKQPYAGIRGNYRKTAYASYWAELINLWMEENVANPALFNLLAHVLTELDGSDARRGGGLEPSVSGAFHGACRVFCRS